MNFRSFARSLPYAWALSPRAINLCGLFCGAMAISVGLSTAASAQNYTVLSGTGPAEAGPAETRPAEAARSDSDIVAEQVSDQAEQTTQVAQAQANQAQANQPQQKRASIAPPPAPSPAPTPFSPSISGIIDLSNGADSIQSLGQLRPRNVEALAADDVSWLSDVILPLYASPGGDHYGWIYQGWLIPKGQTYLAIGRDAGFAMVRAYERLHTFPVLEAREDGWFRVQYSPTGSAWAHSSHLELGGVPLAVEGWEARLRSQSSVYFLETDKAQALRSQPESANNMLSMVPSGSLIEPLDFQGDWMQVRVTRPASSCRALTGATVTQGWMRWRGEERETLVWYRPDDQCP